MTKPGIDDTEKLKRLRSATLTFFKGFEDHASEEEHTRNAKHLLMLAYGLDPEEIREQLIASMDDLHRLAIEQGLTPPDTPHPYGGGGSTR